MKLNKLILALLLALPMMFASCKDDNNETLIFSIDKENISFLENGGQELISLQADDDWVVETNADWCMITPASGSGSAELTLKVDSSYLYDARKAIIYFRNGSETKQLEVDQLGYKKQVLLENENIEIEHYKPELESFFDLKVTANVDYRIEMSDEDASWLSYSVVNNNNSSIPRSGNVHFNYKYNGKTEARKATVKFLWMDKEIEKSIELTVLQKAAPKIVPSRAGDSLALLSIARKLNTYNDWDPSRPIINWSSVETKEVTYYNTELKKNVTEERVIGAAFTLFTTKESLPYEVQYLTECETLEFMGNSNTMLLSINLGPEVTKMPKIKSLAIAGYGLVTLPEEMKNMNTLEELDLNGNNFEEVPLHILQTIPNLKYLNMSANRRWEVGDLNVNKRDSIGLHAMRTEPVDPNDHNYGVKEGFDASIFYLLPKLESLHMSYNYFEGDLPMYVWGMEGLESFTCNLNYLTGNIPDWILKHNNLICWDPYTLIFTQDEGKDSNGKKPGFDNEPATLKGDCPLWDNSDSDDDDDETLGGKTSSFYKNPISKIYRNGVLPLKGNWRAYRFLNNK